MRSKEAHASLMAEHETMAGTLEQVCEDLSNTAELHGEGALKYLLRGIYMSYEIFNLPPFLGLFMTDLFPG